REDDLLANAERVVAASVERAGIEPAEVADPRERDRDQPVEEVPHPGAAQRHARADRHALADLEARDRLPRTAQLGALPGDRRGLVHGGVEEFGVVLRLADAHVERDLRDSRNLHDGAQPEVVLETGAQLALVELLQPGHVAVAVRRHPRLAHRSMSCPQSARLHTRTFFRPSAFVSRISMPTRVGRLHTGQTSITRDTGTGDAFETIPPGSICVPLMRLESRSGRGFVARLTMLRFSTITLPSRGRASMTRPSLPRSLPARTWTTSPLWIFMAVVTTTPPEPG